MVARSACFFAVVGMLVLASTPAHSFNGKRKGFCMQLGLGPGLTSFNQTFTFFTSYPDTTRDSVAYPRDTVVYRSVSTGFSDRQTHVGLSTNFTMGYAPSDRVLISYENRVAWFGTNGHVTVASGTTGLALSYYFSPSAPAAYVTGGIGLGSWRLLEKNSGITGGLGLVLGAGYEFRSHWELEAAVSRTQISDEPWSRTKAVSAHITLGWVGY